MNKNLHNIDKLFKNALENFEENPSSDVWENIDKNLDKKSIVSISKKYHNLKWVASFLLIFSVGMAMYILQIDKKNKIIIKKNDAQIELKDQNNEINNKTPDLPELAGNNTALMPDKVRTGKTSSLDILESGKDNKQQTLFEKNNKKLSTTSLKQMSSTEFALSNQALKSRNNHSEEKDLNNKNSVSRSKSGEVNFQNQTENEQNKIISTIDETAATTDISSQSLQSGNNDLRSIPLADPGINYSKTISLPSLNIVNPIPVNLKYTPSKTIKNIPSNESLFYTTIFFSPDIASYNIENDHPQFEEDAKNQIKKNEKLQLANSYGILVGYKIDKNWILQSGMMVSKSVTSIDSKTVYARPDKNGNINFRLSCFTGPSYIPLKSGMHPSAGDSTTLSAINTLQYIGIPIVLQYRISAGRLSFNPGVGVATNFLVLNKMASSINTATGVQKSIGNSNGLTFAYINSFINLNAAYKLNDKIALSFTPGARFGLTSIVKDAPGKITINSLNFEAGLNIEL